MLDQNLFQCRKVGWIRRAVKSRRGCRNKQLLRQHIAEQGVSIVGICDVDGSTLQKKSREFKDAESYTDFREMLEALGDKVDIVTVSTPDHTHAAAASMAMNKGKHVYCQKPWTL